jgi:hypothetical protein
VIDVEPMIQDELQQLSPCEPVVRDWRDVLDRAGGSGSARTARSLLGRFQLVLVALLIAAAAIVPAVALSASVRSFLGFDRGVQPDYRHARMMVSTPLPGSRVARLWVAPSTDGGQCQFVTYALSGSKPRATRMDGGGSCTVGAHRLRGTLTWAFSSASKETPPVISGRASKVVHPAHVELRWHGGSQRLASSGGFFIGAASSLDSPPFRQLPYDVVVLDGGGRVTARSRIPTSFLYVQWKQVQPRLHAYRVTHGCGVTNIWDCKSR